eukprot:COSAG02_NODE_8176_length_2675_cov_8.580745_4_plen_67_part_00
MAIWAGAPVGPPLCEAGLSLSELASGWSRTVQVAVFQFPQLGKNIPALEDGTGSQYSWKLKFSSII